MRIQMNGSPIVIPRWQLKINARCAAALFRAMTLIPNDTTSHYKSMIEYHRSASTIHNTDLFLHVAFSPPIAPNVITGGGCSGTESRGVN
jgi:hypothetical protein